MLFALLTRAAATLTFWTATINRPTRMAMIAMTTSSSTKVNALRNLMLLSSNSFFSASNDTFNQNHDNKDDDEHGC